MSENANSRHPNGRSENASGPYGPAYDKQIDGRRLRSQHERIREWMLSRDEWKTLAEIGGALRYPEPSISAQMRHLRKKKFGSHRVWRRRRNGKGTWEYRVLPPEKSGTLSLFDSLPSGTPRACAPPRGEGQEASTIPRSEVGAHET
jgi:hypothetical protein